MFSFTFSPSVCPIALSVLFVLDISFLHTEQYITSSWLPSVVHVAGTMFSFTGVPSSTTISLSVNICHGGKSLITLVVRTDSRPAESSYKIFEGKTTTGTPVYSVEKFVLSSGLVYGDFCLNHNIYTTEVHDTENGWSYPAGYYMTVDVGQMKFEMGQVYDNNNRPVSVTTHFSSYLPFQIQYSEWKVLTNSAEAPTNWNTIDFDDSTCDLIIS